MLRKNHLPLLLTTVAFVSGCAMHGPSPAESIESLARENRYEAAVLAYEKASPKDQQLIDITKINNDKSRYEASTLATVTELANRQEYAQAEILLTDTLQNIPSSEPLKKARGSVAEQKKRYLQDSSDALLLAWAKFLAEEQPLLEKMKIARSSEPAFMELLASRQKERRETAEKLGNLGLAQLQHKDPSIPLHNLQLANLLMPDPRWEKAMAELEVKQKRSQLSQKEKKQVDEREKRDKFEKSIQTTKSQFESAMVSGDLLAAKTALEEIGSTENPASPWLSSARERLKKTIDQAVKLALKEGQGHYSKGEIGSALKAWKAVQPLAPDHEALNESIRRAEAFQKNLNNLSESTKK